MKTPVFWQSRNPLSTLLLPASWLYGLGAWANHRFTKPQRAPLPVISLGNLTAGGAGKSPATLALIPLLQSLGHTPHILTRGYGGTHLTAHCVNMNDDWRRVGDEALLLARAAPTWVGSDRLTSAIFARDAGATILVCDDALQHHALYKDISLLVVDGPYGFGNGRLLPAGPLREAIATGCTRVNAVLMIGENTYALTFSKVLPVFGAALNLSINVDISPTTKWIAFAGIGRPEKFYTSLRVRGVDLIETHDFPDHYPYPPHEVEGLLARAVEKDARLITTEKDAVKLPMSLREKITVAPVTLTLNDGDNFKQWLSSHILFKG